MISRPKLLILTVIAADLIAVTAIAADWDIDQINQKFSKSSMAIAAGDTVHYKNGDDVTHNINVTFGDSDPEDQGLQKPGEILNYTFKKAGTYDVRCSIHPRMKMAVKVS